MPLDGFADVFHFPGQGLHPRNEPVDRLRLGGHHGIEFLDHPRLMGEMALQVDDPVLEAPGVSGVVMACGPAGFVLLGVATCYSKRDGI